MAYCFMKLEKYENAVTSLKYVLAISWTIKLTEMELAAFYGLSVLHLYMGSIEKARYYDARVTRGIYESEKSQTYKITVS